jgi:hypothetical protein
VHFDKKHAHSRILAYYFFIAIFYSAIMGSVAQQDGEDPFFVGFAISGLFFMIFLTPSKHSIY